ncbi:Asp-tRNA(Asn)/Glu-tRNA(Gln) amidotransferase subunit GatB [Candidatus Jorgensenbacteria bacterium]|nr:Asp-tRNA(Asn)/Glu-tRNA(Gln) amidotransferase subunit GatB [Candidatus Jorgensenbacteria bacterium]
MYLPTIGLEIHSILKTRTKMFCSCPNDPRERHPNVNVCPVCLGHPGVLPTMNQEAILSVIKLGLALGGTIAVNSHFDRKSYFYPDLPKGYQISQYEQTLVVGGVLKGVRIRRIHLEEDAGRLLHELPGESNKIDASYVDFNRAGVPLMELVTEPDIKTADEAVAFAKELQLILRYLNVSRADMEEGEMRVEANISIRAKETEEWGTKVELKNINSFKAVYEAIHYELRRQEELLEEGKRVAQETRGWNEKTKKTESQRSKESAHDYRYFPEPDLPELELSLFDLESIKRHLPELPEAKRSRFGKEFGLTVSQIELLVEDREFSDYFEEAASELETFDLELTSLVLLYNYLTSDLKGIMRERGVGFSELKIPPEHLTHLVALIARGELSSRIAKDLLLRMFEQGDDPETLLKESGMKLMSNESDLRGIVATVLEANPQVVIDFKKGKQNSIQFLIGQVMAKTKGQASPNVAKKLLVDELEKLVDQNQK